MKYKNTSEIVVDILRLVTVIVEEDQINTPTCSPRSFIRQHDKTFQILSKTVKIINFQDG